MLRAALNNVFLMICVVAYEIHYLLRYQRRSHSYPRREVPGGAGVQYSVFTCHATAAQMNDMREELLRLTQRADRPLLMVVPICHACAQGIWMHGKPIEEDVPYLVV